MIGIDALLGGLTGIIGNVITSITNYKTMKASNEHDEKMIGLQTAAQKERMHMQIEVSKAKISGELEIKEAEIYQTGQEVGNQQLFSEKWIERLFTIEGWVRYLSIPFGVIIATAFAFVDFLRGFMRPGLTLYLTGLTTVITYMAWDIIKKHGMEMSISDAIGIYEKVISIVIYLTVSCVTWWFADRRTAKFLQNIGKKKSNEGM